MHLPLIIHLPLQSQVLIICHSFVLLGSWLLKNLDCLQPNEKSSIFTAMLPHYNFLVQVAEQRFWISSSSKSYKPNRPEWLRRDRLISTSQCHRRCGSKWLPFSHVDACQIQRELNYWLGDNMVGDCKSCRWLGVTPEAGPWQAFLWHLISSTKLMWIIVKWPRWQVLD